MTREPQPDPWADYDPERDLPKRVEVEPGSGIPYTGRNSEPRWGGMGSQAAPAGPDAADGGEVAQGATEDLEGAEIEESDEGPRLWCSEHMEPYCPRHSRQETDDE